MKTSDEDFVAATWQHSAFAAPDANNLYILPDTGAVGNLCGSTWAQQAVNHMRAAKLPFKVAKQQRPKPHTGVGEGICTSRWFIEIPMTLGKVPYIYKADVLEGPSAHIPALMGCNDMSKLNVHYSVRTGSFIIPGPGGLQVGASPGTEFVQMRRRGEAFHWMLPVNEHLRKNWLALPAKKQETILRQIQSH